MKIPSLADAAVSGEFNSKIRDEKQEMLRRGDITGLMAINKRQFGGFFMGPDDGDDDQDDKDDLDDDGKDDDDDDKDDDKSDEAKRLEELQAENKRRRLKARQQDKELKQQDQEIKAMQKQIADLTKGKDTNDDADDDKSDAELAEATTKLEEQQRVNDDLLIRLEFTSHTKYKWKNPKAALKLLDLNDVEINDDGEVEGLDDAIEALVKSDPYLLDKGKSDKDDDDEDDKDTSTGRKTGTRKRGNPNRDKLLQKYPALRR